MHDRLSFDGDARHDFVKFGRAIHDVGHPERRLSAYDDAGRAGKRTGWQEHDLIGGNWPPQRQEQNAGDNISS
jgi:hypothetical protein